jgi:hypothetical protein
MILPHITDFNDLVTSKEATTSGFIAQAKEKIDLATPHIEAAIKLQNKLTAVVNTNEYIEDNTLRKMLLSVVGLSDKAIKYLQPEQETTIINETLKNLQKKAGKNWNKELVLRYLLTKGDSLGGSSRNLTGANAKIAFANSVQKALTEKGIPFSSENIKKTLRIRKISWKNRLMVFDKNSKIVGKNIDVIVLDSSSHDDENTLLDDKSTFIACGEVKGGIDPAGADEHWKTANSALERVRYSFGMQRPALFFVAAAIVSSMAKEVVSQLRDNRLTFTANLTKPEQLSDLANWLVSL